MEGGFTLFRYQFISGFTARRFVSILLLAAASISTTYAFQFERMGLDQGPGSFRVYDILQDHEGFMWFATLNGLSRYDGYEFVTFRHSDSILHSLSGNFTTALGETADGRLLVGTVDGVINIMSRPSQEFSNILVSPISNIGLHNSHTREIFTTRSGDVWIATLGTGLVQLSQRDSTEITNYRHDPNAVTSISSDSIYSVGEDRSGNLWIGTNGGLEKLGSGSNVFEHVSFADERVNTILGGGVTAISIDSLGMVWVGTSLGLLQIDPQNNSPRFHDFVSLRLPVDETSFITSLHTSKEVVWIGTTKGLCRLQRETGRVERFVHDPLDPASLSDNLVYRIRGDYAGNVWVATDNGVCKHYALHDLVRPVVNGPAGITDAVHEDSRGTLWVGTRTGLHAFYDGLSNPDQKGNRKRIYLKGEDVQAIVEGLQGEMWIGTDGGGLYRIEKDGEVTQFVLPSKKTIGVRSMVREGLSRFWIGTFSQGLILFEPLSEEFVLVSDEWEALKELAGQNVTEIVLGLDGSLWVGTEGAGLFNILLSHGNPTVHRYVNQEANTSSISNNRIYSLFLDRRGNLWVSTGKGLDKIDSRAGTIERVLTDGTTFSGIIIGIEEDNQGRMWLSTFQNGVYALDPVRRELRSFTSAEGLPTNMFRWASFKRSNGEIMLGSDSGVLRFVPESIPWDCQCLTMSLLEFRVLDDPIESLTDEGKTIELDFTQNYLSFMFGALGYPNQQRVEITYKLEGSDEQWFRLGENRRVSYRPLDPGDYILRAKAYHPMGGFCKKELSIPILIAPPFWGTWWFRTSLGALCLATGFGLHRYRLSKVLAIEKMRGQIASDLHDDIGSSLGSIALSCDVICGSSRISEDEKGQLAGVSRIARETAEHLRDIVWLINPANDDLESFVLKLKHEASVLLQQVRWTGAFHNTRIKATVDMQFRHHVYLIFKEILHNIVKHANATEVRIEVRVDENSLFLEVSDNGVGIHSSPSNGLGMKSIRSRAEKIGGDLVIETGKASGTSMKLVVNIP